MKKNLIGRIHVPLLCLVWASVAQAQPVDLLQKYPTKLTSGDSTPARARDWTFTAADVFRVTKFSFDAGKDLHVESGEADLGLGHCDDGVVWAVLIPREGSKLTGSAFQGEEAISHVWLRFHPKEIKKLFPAPTVFPDGATNLTARIRAIANQKMRSSWQAGGKAMIPGPKDLTVDVDTKKGVRRFFVVDTEAPKVEYVNAFERQPVRR